MFKAVLVFLLMVVCVQRAWPQAIPDEEPAILDTAEGEKTPSLVEVGFGTGISYAPAYPGSEQSKLWLLPVPYFIYRGEIFRADRDGNPRARLFYGANFEMNVDLAGGLPSSSANLDARAGMPNLEWLGEVGPALNFFLIRDNQDNLRFMLPVRAAFSTNFSHIAGRGFVFQPSLVFARRPYSDKSLEINFVVSANFGDTRFMGYFYDVPAEYATPTRPAYDAQGGYLDTTVSTGLAWWIPKADLKIRPFITYETLRGATNDSSPLMKQRSALFYSIAVIWDFYKSDTKVKSAEAER